MLLLYPGRTRGRYACTVYLHSTMLLLYLALIVLFGIGALWFTFHYASTLSACDIIKYLCGFLIYIPLCFYFIPGAGTTKSTKFFIYIPLCFYFMECRLSARQVAAVFTFHYASTLSSYDPIDCVADFIYIPLCFYFILLRSAWQSLPGIYLHSTMLLLYPIYGPVTNPQVNIFTFHYASTLSRSKALFKQTSCIYIPLCFYFITFGRVMRWHRIRHLHSTMLLLYPVLKLLRRWPQRYLHSTMLLLYP